MRIHNRCDFNAGVLFLLIAAFFAVYSTDYSLGTATRMGPGYFPMLLGCALALIGIAVAAQALTGEHQTGGRIGSWAWKPLLCIVGASGLFALCLSGVPQIGLPVLGMGIGVYMLVIVASIAASRFDWPSVLGLATVLAVGSWLVFIKALGLLIPMWPWFLD